MDLDVTAQCRRESRDGVQWTIYRSPTRRNSWLSLSVDAEHHATGLVVTLSWWSGTDPLVADDRQLEAAGCRLVRGVLKTILEEIGDAAGAPVSGTGNRAPGNRRPGGDPNP